jgi:hypothetical protein
MRMPVKAVDIESLQLPLVDDSKALTVRPTFSIDLPKIAFERQVLGRLTGKSRPAADDRLVELVAAKPSVQRG